MPCREPRGTASVQTGAWKALFRSGWGGVHIGLIDATVRPLQSSQRVSPVSLKASQTVRLKRIAPKAIYKPDSGLLEVPMAKGSDPTADLVTFLRHLLPPEVAGSPDGAAAS